MSILSYWRRSQTPLLEAGQQVNADADRCVQCGVCSYNCPVGIEVREYARRGANVTDSGCIGCGTCINVCPRGTLRWGSAIILQPNDVQVVDPLALPILEWR